MAIELVFLAVATSAAAVALWALAAAGALVRPARDVGERAAFWAVVAPVLAAGLALAFFVGWAAQEPDPSDEWIERELWLVTALAALPVARAIARALRASVARVRVSIGTVGLLSPRVLVSDAFRRAAGPEALRAALAHEVAHRRHRDPLRIWLVAFAADLQWPLPGARARFDRWLSALEAARDDEALAHGASPGALAEAILVAARTTPSTAGAVAAAAGSASSLAVRVRRLLRGEARPRTPRRRRGAATLVGLAVLATAWLGHGWGDLLIGALPGVGR